MPSREELRQQVLRDQTQRYLYQPEEPEPGLTRIGPLDLRTGRYYQVHQDGTATPDGRKTFDSAHKTGQAVRRIPGNREAHLDGRPATKPRVATIQAEEFLQIALFIGTYLTTSRYIGGDRNRPTDITDGMVSAYDARVDRLSRKNLTFRLTTDNISGAKNIFNLPYGTSGAIQNTTTATTLGWFAASPGMGSYSALLPIGTYTNRNPREIINQTFAREQLWYDYFSVDENGGLDPVFPDEIYAVYQGEILTQTVTSSWSTAGGPIFYPPNSTNYQSLHQHRVSGDVWITPTYTKPAFLGSNVLRNTPGATNQEVFASFYLNYRPLILAQNGTDCIFRREQVLLVDNNIGTYESYIQELQGWDDAIATNAPQFYVDYYLLWQGQEYLITNPELLFLLFVSGVNAAAGTFELSPLVRSSFYADVISAPYGTRFWNFVDDRIYQAILPTTVVDGQNIVNTFALEASNQINVKTFEFSTDDSTMTATLTEVGAGQNYKMGYYPDTLSPGSFTGGSVGSASFAP